MAFTNVSLRWPSEFKTKMERRALVNRRSLNSEVLVMLEAVLASDDKSELPATAGGAPAAGDSSEP